MNIVDETNNIFIGKLTISPIQTINILYNMYNNVQSCTIYCRLPKHSVT